MPEDKINKHNINESDAGTLVPDCGAGREIALPALMEGIRKKIDDLRDEQRKSVLRIYETEPGLDDKSTGDVFIESVGTIVHLENGDFQHIYNREAVAAREKMVMPVVRQRRKMFEAVAGQFGSEGRVLNIGAGGDIVPINALKSAGLEVINTDYSQDAADVLAGKTDAPVFAVDLANLDRVMPQKSVDFMVGNSTLGYIEPNKLKSVVANLCSVMKKGGVFTFDLFPHGVYTRIFENNEIQTVVNESEICPAKLRQYVLKYGPGDGINAMGVYQNYKSIAIQLALMEQLKDLFESHGFRCAGGFYESGNYECKVLRVVSPEGEKGLLNPIEGETAYANMEEAWEMYAGKMNNSAYQLLCLDRGNAAVLAKIFNIDGNYKDLPYLVSRYVSQSQDPGSLPESIRREITKSIHPSIVRERMMPYLEGKRVLPQVPLPMAVQVDQILHKFVMSGQAPFDAEVAERKIDAAYDNANFCKSAEPGKSSGAGKGKGGKKRAIIKRSGFKVKKNGRKRS